MIFVEVNFLLLQVEINFDNRTVVNGNLFQSAIKLNLGQNIRQV